MDGLSVGAGAIAILQAIGAIPSIIDTLRTLIHISDEIKALTNELTTLQALQDHLKSQVDLLSDTDPRLRVPEPIMMQSARTTLAELVDELHELVARYKNKKRRRIRFVWDRNKIAQMGARARAAREALTMAMQDLSLALMNTHGKVLLDIQSFTTLMPGIMDAGFQRLEGLITTSRNLTPAPAAPVSDARLNIHVAPASPPLLPGYSEDPFFELLTVGRLTDIDADPSDPHPSTISMQASVYSPSSACSQSCSCRCHLSSALRTPSWLQPVLGSVLLSYSCIPLLGAGPCDQANCVRAISRTELTYYFPARVLKRALCFLIEVGGSFGYGAGLHFGVARVFSSHDEAWETVNFGGSEDLKRVWAERPGPYSPLDVNEAGMSLLMDAMARKNTKAAMFLIDQWRLRESKNLCDRFTIMVAREMISLPSSVSSTSELEPLLIIASLSPDGPRTPFSPLHQAIQSGSSLSSLLSSSPPPDLNQRDFLGRTPLIHASRINNLPAVQLLLRAGAGAKLIDVRDSLGQTALLAALVGGHIRIALALLNAGCAVRVANDVGRTPLHAIFRTWDSWNPHPDAAEVLARLVQGGDVCARSSYGYTPLHYLVWRARAPVPLVTKVLKMVLDAGADLDTKDKALSAPAVLYAVRARSSAVLRILVERGARLTFVDQSGANILGELATSADLEGLKIIEGARMSGVNVFLADAKQHTPLGKWRERVRLRKLEDTTISIREETAVFELLVRDIRDRQLQVDVDRLGEIFRGIEMTNLSQANNSLSQLVQKKTEIRLIQDIETLRVLRTQLKEGMWEAARETVEEIIEICRDRLKRSPWAEDQYHWRELQKRVREDPIDQYEQDGVWSNDYTENVKRREKRPRIESLDWEYHPNEEVPAVIRKLMARELKANDDSSTDYNLDSITDGSTTSDASTLKRTYETRSKTVKPTKTVQPKTPSKANRKSPASKINLVVKKTKAPETAMEVDPVIAQPLISGGVQDTITTVVQNAAQRRAEELLALNDNSEDDSDSEDSVEIAQIRKVLRKEKRENGDK